MSATLLHCSVYAILAYILYPPTLYCSISESSLHRLYFRSSLVWQTLASVNVVLVPVLVMYDPCLSVVFQSSPFQPVIRFPMSATLARCQLQNGMFRHQPFAVPTSPQPPTTSNSQAAFPLPWPSSGHSPWPMNRWHSTPCPSSLPIHPGIV